MSIIDNIVALFSGEKKSTAQHAPVTPYIPGYSGRPGAVRTDLPARALTATQRAALGYADISSATTQPVTNAPTADAGSTFDWRSILGEFYRPTLNLFNGVPSADPYEGVNSGLVNDMREDPTLPVKARPASGGGAGGNVLNGVNLETISRGVINDIRYDPDDPKAPGNTPPAAPVTTTSGVIVQEAGFFRGQSGGNTGLPVTQVLGAF